jgi:hypothetical protein
MKKTLFNIDESEKRRILEMHETATKKQYLGEQQAATTPTTPVTAPGTKDPAAFVKSVANIAINNDPTSKLTFKSKSQPDGVNFTTKVTKTPGKKDPSTGKLTSDVYTIMLKSNSIDLRFDFTCSYGARFVQSVVKDDSVFVTNPIENNKTYSGSENINNVLKQLSPELITKSNPFLVEFKQDFCS